MSRSGCLNGSIFVNSPLLGVGFAGLESNQVAITVTRTSSPNVSSITEPKIMFASGSAALEMISAASLTSNKPSYHLPQ
jgi:hypothetical protein